MTNYKKRKEKQKEVKRKEKLKKAEVIDRCSGSVEEESRFCDLVNAIHGRNGPLFCPRIAVKCILYAPPHRLAPAAIETRVSKTTKRRGVPLASPFLAHSLFPFLPRDARNDQANDRSEFSRRFASVLVQRVHIARGKKFAGVSGLSIARAIVSHRLDAERNAKTLCIIVYYTLTNNGVCTVSRRISKVLRYFYDASYLLKCLCFCRFFPLGFLFVSITL